MLVEADGLHGVEEARHVVHNRVGRSHDVVGQMKVGEVRVGDAAVHAVAPLDRHRGAPELEELPGKLLLDRQLALRARGVAGVVAGHQDGETGGVHTVRAQVHCIQCHRTWGFERGKEICNKCGNNATLLKYLEEKVVLGNGQELKKKKKTLSAERAVVKLISFTKRVLPVRDNNCLLLKLRSLHYDSVHKTRRHNAEGNDATVYVHLCVWLFYFLFIERKQGEGVDKGSGHDGVRKAPRRDHKAWQIT